MGLGGREAQVNYSPPPPSDALPTLIARMRELLGLVSLPQHGALVTHVARMREVLGLGEPGPVGLHCRV